MVGFGRNEDGRIVFCRKTDDAAPEGGGRAKVECGQ